MDAIKSKMHKLSGETEEATIKANRFEEEGVRATKEAERVEAVLGGLTKKNQAQESAYDVNIEDLFNATVKLEEKEKVFGNAEGEVGSAIRRTFLLENEADMRENRLAAEVSGLLRACLRADEQINLKNKLELDISTNEEDIDELENCLKEARYVLAESERKFEDISRKFTNLEAENMRSLERADMEERKITELEEELRVVGSNLQDLEVAEEKAFKREETYQRQIHELCNRLKMAETQAENSEMNIQRLNIRIDQIEDELIHEKLKIKAISDDVDGTFRSMETGECNRV